MDRYIDFLMSIYSEVTIRPNKKYINHKAKKDRIILLPNVFFYQENVYLAQTYIFGLERRNKPNSGLIKGFK